MFGNTMEYKLGQSKSVDMARAGIKSGWNI
jgi:hypothetical protein